VVVQGGWTFNLSLNPDLSLSLEQVSLALLSNRFLPLALWEVGVGEGAKWFTCIGHTCATSIVSLEKKPLQCCCELNACSYIFVQ